MVYLPVYWYSGALWPEIQEMEMGHGSLARVLVLRRPLARQCDTSWDVFTYGVGQLHRLEKLPLKFLATTITTAKFDDCKQPEDGRPLSLARRRRAPRGLRRAGAKPCLVARFRGSAPQPPERIRAPCAVRRRRAAQTREPKYAGCVMIVVRTLMVRKDDTMAKSVMLVTPYPMPPKSFRTLSSQIGSFLWLSAIVVRLADC